jgi:phage FluMu gp28-like protein
MPRKFASVQPDSLTSFFLESFLPYQRKWLLDPSQFKIGLWARQTGKDFTCAAEAALDCSLHGHKHWLIVACGERQALESLRKAREWTYLISALSRRHRRPRVSFKENANEISFENGSRITALPARPETIRGYSANIILTEFAFHEDPDAVWKAVYPSVSNPMRGGQKRLRIITTPAGHGNLFHQLWSAQDNHLFWRQSVTIHDAVAQGLSMNIAQLRAGMTDAEAWAQEYECHFVDQSSVLLPYSLLEKCESADATEFPSDLSRCSGDLFIGIDFGRKQDLTACWVLERVGHEFWTREVLTLERMSTPAQANLLRARLHRARRVCLDYTGAGIGLGDMLSEEFGTWSPSSPHGRIELCSFTPALKQELFPRLRASLERGQLWLPASAPIREDLHSLHRVVSPNGSISYRATHSADGHSDRATALALALRAAEQAPVIAAASSVGRRIPSLRSR